MSIADSLDNSGKLRLKRGTTNKEAINIRLGDELTAVASVCRTTVLNSSCCSNFSADVISEPRTNISVSILSNLGSSNLTSANSPHRLISDNNISPGLDRVFAGIKLLLEDIICLTSLTLLNRLTNAKNSLESSGLSLGYLLGNDIISLTEELSALRVTNKSPLKTEVNDLFSADLTSECTIAFTADVLG